MKFEIKHRFTHFILFSVEAGSMKLAVEAAVKSSADLRFADLKDAKNLRLPSGETWKEYLSETAPALLTAGGKKLEEVANEKVWGCHSWTNCPIATAFGVVRLESVPILFRPRAAQFVELFDANQIPLADVLKGAKA